MSSSLKIASCAPVSDPLANILRVHRFHRTHSRTRRLCTLRVQVLEAVELLQTFAAATAESAQVAHELETGDVLLICSGCGECDLFERGKPFLDWHKRNIKLLGDGIEDRRPADGFGVQELEYWLLGQVQKLEQRCGCLIQTDPGDCVLNICC